MSDGCKKEELSVARQLFGAKIEDTEYPGLPTVHLYMEDDEWWSKKVSFSVYWIPDLIATLKAIQDKYPQPKRLCRD